MELLEFPYYQILYVVTLVIALVTYNKFFDTPLRFFPILIAYTFFNELLGYFIISFEEFSLFDEEEFNWHNTIIYNIYQIFFLWFLFWLYHKLFKRKKDRFLVKLFGSITIVAYGISLFFQNPLHSGLYFADCLACGFIIPLVILHFKQLYRLNNTQPSRHNHMVWFNLGMLVFHFYYPIYLLNGYHNADFFLEYHLRQVLWMVISIMYTLFIIGFLLGRRPYFG